MAGVDVREQVRPEQRNQDQAGDAETQKDGPKQHTVIEAPSQQKGVSFAEAVETFLEPLMETAEHSWFTMWLIPSLGFQDSLGPVEIKHHRGNQSPGK